ncbi:VOC family protein [Thioalkalivibrio sp.]|uniref:VOC family protein n=1 Tax=Thioalkalivibrio sp. TaxID=2093813 RepID=UPI0012D6709F|nr:VOC family protein [Thioalkalivibrio sp.]TVP81642.1 MAG: VOC family protein [Thioalkalivibrio sp.]
MIRLPHNGARLALAALILIVVGGCAGLDPARIPPIDTADTQPIPGKIVWHDLLTEDPTAARRFYAGLFGWTFRDVGLGRGQSYKVIEHDGRIIGGLVDARRIGGDVNVSRWIPVLSVADMAAAVAAVRAAGGTVYQAPLDIPQRGLVAVVADPQGAVLTLLEPRGGDPADRPAEPGDWLWNEIWSSDPDATLAFYKSLVPDYEVNRMGDAYSNYRYLSAGGVPRVGVMLKPVDRIPDTWVAYVKVSDPAATAAAAERLGGEVLLPPRKNPRGGEVAILNDPTGAGFLVQRWEPVPEHQAAR